MEEIKVNKLFIILSSFYNKHLLMMWCHVTCPKMYITTHSKMLKEY